jgi:hypothetical protein
MPEKIKKGIFRFYPHIKLKNVAKAKHCILPNILRAEARSYFIKSLIVNVERLA